MASGSIRLADAGHETQRCGIGERSVKAPAIVRADEGSTTGPHRRDMLRACSITMYTRPLCSKAICAFDTRTTDVGWEVKSPGMCSARVVAGDDMIQLLLPSCGGEFGRCACSALLSRRSQEVGPPQVRVWHLASGYTDRYGLSAKTPFRPCSPCEPICGSLIVVHITPL